MKPNKQKTDWEKEFRKKHEILEFSNGNWIATGKEVYCKEMEKDISNLLQQQREEIIKVIKEHRPVFFKGDLHSLLSQDEVMKVREVLRIEILEELGVDCKEIRDRLKQITNLKEK